MTEIEKLWQRTCEVIPGGVQTYSKMPDRHAKGYPFWLNRADGIYVYDTEGRKYLDYPCSLGAILLGHGHWRVTDFVKMQIDDGVLFSLPHRKEGLLAEQLVDLIPCAEQVRFLKTGSEACSAAVKIARSVTGRSRILCCGYHGWHDWYASTTPYNRGCVDYNVKQFPYNDLTALEDMMVPKGRAKESLVAAVIMEPYVYDPPQDGYLEGVKGLCEKYGCLLIFDEMVTGFRTPGGSAQKMFGVTPHLATFGKAMGNGYPIACVCGAKEFMQVINDGCFVSGTFGGELVGIAAALAVVEAIRTEHAIERIWQNGTMFIERMNQYVETKGYPCRTFFCLPPAQKTLFWQQCIQRGLLFGYAQFMTPLHDENVITYTANIVRMAMDYVKEHWDAPEKVLDGPVANSVIRRNEHAVDGSDTRGLPDGSPLAQQVDGDAEDAVSADA